jgi:hypothetical protein
MPDKKQQSEGPQRAFDRLVDAKVTFESNSTFKPNRAYMGKEDLEEIKLTVIRYAGYLLGMKVYVERQASGQIKIAI